MIWAKGAITTGSNKLKYFLEPFCLFRHFAAVGLYSLFLFGLNSKYALENRKAFFQ